MSEPDAARPARRGAFALIRIALAALVLIAVAIALAKNWSAVADHLGEVSASAWVLALAFGIASPALSMLGWRALLADLGSPLHVAPASGVFLVGQLGKYLPGSVWSVLAQAEIAARLDVPRRRTGVVGLVTMALALLCGALVGLPAVPALLGRGGGDALPLIGIAVVLLLGALWPPLLNRAIATGLRLLRREPLEHDFSGRAIVAAAAWTTLAWLSTGAIVWAFARDIRGLTGSGGEVALVSISGFCLAAAIGMASILLPAGVGVREGILVLLLVGVMTTPAATAVVVLARFVTVIADVLWAGIGWAWARAHHLLPEHMSSRT